MNRYRRSSAWDSFMAVLVCIVVLVVVVIFMCAKIEAYNGDVSCLFIRCVKVIK